MTRLAKSLGKRIDGGYLRRLHPLRRWRRAIAWSIGLIAVGWFIVAGFWIDRSGGGMRPRLVGSLHNPGPVSRAHAYFETDCAQCHSGDGKGGFFRGVSDNACLVCHDAAIHSERQKVAANPSEVSPAKLVLGVSDPTHPFHMRSAACATCHVEHRGMEALSAASDQHCVQCHRELPVESHSATRMSATTTPSRSSGVTAFAVGRHPKFGLPARSEATRLIFPHDKHHNTSAKGAHTDKLLKDFPLGREQDCVACHQSSEPPARFEGYPPSPLPGDRPAQLAGSSDRRYMRPINYERHCAICHESDLRMPATVSKLDLAKLRATTNPSAKGDDEEEIELPETAQVIDAKLPHGDVALVRSAVAQQLGAVIATDRLKFDSDGKQRVIPPASWYLANIEAHSSDIPGASSPEGEAAAAVTFDDFVNFYTAATLYKACAKCHFIEGDAPEIPAKPGAKGLTIVMTGISSSSRRWLPHSQFDHDAHRSMRCIECHKNALTSAQSTDVLIPDMTAVGNATRGCVECHQPEAVSSTVRAAPANCVTCHTYHDRSKERPPTGPMLAPSTAPSVAAAQR